jgi:hypothetical protein
MMYKKIFLRCLILFMILGAFAEAQLQPARVFSAEPVLGGARAAALGDAYVSDPYDVNSFYWNPATLTFLKNYSISANTIIDWKDLVWKNTIAVPYKIDGSNSAALGLSASYPGSFMYYSLNLGYARILSSNLSAGVFIDLHRGNTRTGELWGGSGAFGFLYAPSPGVSYALVFRGVGGNVRYSSYSTYEKLDKVEPNRSILIGTTFIFPSVNRSPFIYINLAAEKIIGVNKFISKAGLEYWIASYVALRCGVVSGPTLTRGSVATGRAGLGLHIGHIRFDYGITPSVAEEQFHQMSISYDLY